MTYRNDLDALSSRHAALEHEVATKARELDATTRLLADATAKARQPILPNIRIATPCTADWNKMTGDDRVRACAACNKHVYNLSAMTRDEAEALIVAKEGKLCVRYFQRKDGTILLKDCEIGISKRRRSRLVGIGATLLLAGGGILAYKLTRPAAPVAPHEEPYAVAGGIGPIDEPLPMMGGAGPMVAPPPVTTDAVTGKLEGKPILHHQFVRPTPHPHHERTP